MLNINSVSLFDSAKFDKSNAPNHDLRFVNFNNMNLKYTLNNKNCVDLEFLKFIDHVWTVDLSNNKIECVENVQYSKTIVHWLDLRNNNLLSFDFADLIGLGFTDIYLTNNHLSTQSLKNFDDKTLSAISVYRHAMDVRAINIHITKGNNVKLPLKRYSKVNIL